MTEVSVAGLKVDEVSFRTYSEACLKLTPLQSRFSGDGADLNLLHWLRQAEQAIEVLQNVRAPRYDVDGKLTHCCRMTSLPISNHFTHSSSRSSFLPHHLPCPNLVDRYGTSSHDV